MVLHSCSGDSSLTLFSPYLISCLGKHRTKLHLRITIKHIYVVFRPKNTEEMYKKGLLKNTITVWHTAHKHIGDPPVLSQVSPIWGIKQFNTIFIYNKLHCLLTIIPP